MAFLKKSLFLVLFLGLVNLSICEEEKREEENKEEEDENEALSEVKRGFLEKLKTGAKDFASAFVNSIKGT
uniref:Frenatin 4.1 n=1 Tax=Nyctimystes infrafrenatus TaxID=61195 RepID=FRE41_NYCIN|nr:RecName: Full=Frenatin 4.1; Contains: RecName: Full=Frenatin 4.2; Flags: Precursor [Nyctimystes infrafrenatus]CAI77675.1 frenatin 4.1 precursor [Nyctimystes infrafrenatus]